MNSVQRPSELSPLLVLFLLLIALFAGRRRTRIAGQIRVASPTLIPLASDEARQFARDFGAAYAELLDGERGKGEA
ncbi:MAG: hypothetical protein ABIQ05_05205 [Candidatus Limnocylindria bacterium]